MTGLGSDDFDQGAAAEFTGALFDDGGGSWEWSVEGPMLRHAAVQTESLGETSAAPSSEGKPKARPNEGKPKARPNEGKPKVRPNEGKPKAPGKAYRDGTIDGEGTGKVETARPLSSKAVRIRLTKAHADGLTYKYAQASVHT